MSNALSEDQPFTDREIFLIRQASPIAHVIGERQPLHKTESRRWEGLCPFFPDDPSHTINVLPTRGLWICFGCNDGGDVFDYVKRLHKLDFKQAVARLYRQLEAEL
ncbi:CHC2 zinc finger domain-containing protein [Nonomuraea sp. NPDC004702]